MQSVTLNKIGKDDCMPIWQWRNDALTREMSLTTDYVPWPAHQTWFKRVLNDQSQYMYIASMVSSHSSAEKVVTDKVAMVRFDCSQFLSSSESSAKIVNTKSYIPSNNTRINAVLVSINLNPQHRGRGLAIPILQTAITTFKKALQKEGIGQSYSNFRLDAQIKVANHASVAVFQKCGFVQQNMQTANVECSEKSVLPVSTKYKTDSSPLESTNTFVTFSLSFDELD